MNVYKKFIKVYWQFISVCIKIKVHKRIQGGEILLEIDIEKLKVAQARAWLSLEELANKAGISRSSVSKIMRGERRANPKTIGLLAKAMELDVIELIKR